MNGKRFEHERRKAPRRHADSFCTAPISGAVKDLSGSGLGLETWDPLAVQTEFVLTIGQVGRQVRLPCRVMWCRLVRTEATESGAVIPIYRSGVRFLRLEERTGAVTVRRPAGDST